ncbi:MAG: right-handed parallel beta-helix repeat-containing protein [Chloroflexia bacterium]
MSTQGKRSGADRFRCGTLAGLLLLALALLATGAGAPLAARLEAANTGTQNCVPGPHSGTVAVSQTWCLSDNPHFLNGDVTVNAGVVLTVEAGVTVKANDNVELKMLGHLEALGTITQPITFTSMTDTGAWQWSGLLFDGASASGNLEHVTVRYTGDDNSLGLNASALLARNVSPGQVRIADSRVVDNRKGLWLIDSRATVSNTLFSGVADAYQYPLEIQGTSSVVTLTANTFTANPRNRVLLQPGAMMGADAALTPQIGLDGYELAGDFTVPAGVTLTIAPGVTVMADRNRELKVLGHLEAAGTPSQPITFTSVANTGSRQWTGLVFDGGTGHLDHAAVRYGGDDNSLGLEPAGLVARNVTAGEVRLEHASLITACGFVAQNSHMSFISSTLSGNGGVGCPDFEGGQLKGSATVFTMTHSLFQNNNGGILFWLGDARATFDHNQFLGNGENPEGWADEYVLWVSDASPVITLTNNLFQGNAGGVSFGGDGQLTLINNVFVGQTGHAYTSGSALSVYGNLTAIHNTFAHNDGMNCDPYWCKQDAIWVAADHWPEPYRVVFTNTIIADHQTGMVLCNGAVRMDNTLWYSNTTNVITQAASCLGGVLTETGHLEGPAAFAADGYHLTCGSVALQAGVDAGVSDDIDAEPRPQPAGTHPDLGADESPCEVAGQFTALKSALPPQWIVSPDPAAPGGYRGSVRQRYAVNYHYPSSPAVLPPLDVAVTDTLPAELAFAEDHQPAMDFQRQGQQLTWRTLSPVQEGEFGWIWLEGVDDDPQAGEDLVNTAELRAGDWHFDLEAGVTVPLFAPFLVSPQNGETCRPGPGARPGPAGRHRAGVGCSQHGHHRDGGRRQRRLHRHLLLSQRYDASHQGAGLRRRSVQRQQPAGYPHAAAELLVPTENLLEGRGLCLLVPWQRRQADDAELSPAHPPRPKHHDDPGCHGQHQLASRQGPGQRGL